MTSDLFRRQLEAASRIEHPYSGLRSSASEGTPAAVLVTWAFSAANPSEPQVLLTRRTEKVETHKGQMAFPGGMRDPGDLSDAETALREAHEEVGLSASLVEVLGELPPMWTVTGFLVTPVVSILKPSLEDVLLVNNEDEIAESLWVPRSRLEQTYRREFMRHQSVRYPIDVFLDEPHRVWGVTGALLKNLLERLERVR